MMYIFCLLIYLVTDVSTPWPKLRVKKRNKALGQDDRRFEAKLYKIPQARKRENTLRRIPSKS